MMQYPDASIGKMKNEDLTVDKIVMDMDQSGIGTKRTLQFRKE